VSESIQIALVTAMINAAVTWGVISTKLAWLRRDIDAVKERLDNLDFPERRWQHERRDFHQSNRIDHP
jgi:hypothetical protein